MAETLGLYSRAPAALRATSQISVASDRAGLYGEEHRHFHLECRGQIGLCFVLSPMPAEFPEIAEGLWEPLGRSFWGIPPSASHSIPLSQPSSPPLRGGPKSLVWLPVLPSSLASLPAADMGTRQWPLFICGEKGTFLTDFPGPLGVGLPASPPHPQVT